MRGETIVHPAGEAVLAQDGAPVQVPEGFKIFTAQFGRAGDDLQLTAADGQSLTVLDYFSASQPPALVAPGGAMLTGDVVSHLAGPRAPGQFAQAGEPELGESIGRVETLTGTATATRASGEIVELSPGQPVYQGDVIETGADTELALLIVDGTLASMKSDARMILDELVYEPGGSTNSMLISLVEGAFAFITGAVAGSGGMDVQTPVAVMAIRGTVPIAVVAGDGTTNFFAGSDSTYQLLHLTTRQLIAEISSGFGYVLNDPNATIQPFEIDPAAAETINDLLDTLNDAATSLGLLGIISGQDFVPYSPFGEIDRSDELVALFEFLELLDYTQTEQNVASAELTNADLLDGDAPLALDDAGVTIQGKTITIDVLANDVDPDPDTPLKVIFATVEPGFLGTVEVDEDAGTITYIPGAAYDYLAEGESVTVPITYAVSNGDGGFTSASVNVLVEGSNDSPAITLAAGDSTGAELVETDEALTAGGTLSLFDIDLSNTVSASVVSVTVGPAGAASATGPAAALPDVSALLAMMNVISTVGPGVSDGHIVWNFDSGDFTFDYLALNETEVLTFQVLADDGGLSDTQEVVITIAGTNDAPIALADAASTGEDSAVSIDVLANDSDPDASDTVTVTSASLPAGSGTVTVQPDGTLTYDPGDAFQHLAVGEATEVAITYHIADNHGATASAVATVTVTGVNDGPTAKNDADTTDENGTVTIDVLANDTDPDTSDDLTVTGVAVTSGQGSVAVGPGGVITYDPGAHYQHLAAGESATVEITYHIADGHGGNSSAVATVTVTGVNDGPTAHDDTAATGEDSAKTIDVLANDSDPDASDTLTVTSASVAPGNGTVTVAGSSITYDPGAAFQHLGVGQFATVAITYHVADGHGGTSSAVATVTVTGVNDGPTAVADAATTDEDSAVSIAVLGNDSDPDADILKVTGAGVTSGLGSAVVGPGGTSVVYDPGQAYQHLAAGESATVTITYQIADGHGGTSSAIATVTVTGVNDGPTAGDASITTDENSAITFDALADDPDASDSLTVTSANVTSGGGTAALSGDTSIVYDPGAAYQHLAVGESATVEITYTVDDGQGGTSTAVATVTVSGVNDGPTANADIAATNENSAKAINVLSNDTDPDTSDTLTVTGASVTSGGGTVTRGENGILTYDPGQAYQHLAVGESATVEIVYHIADGHLGTASAVVTVTVTGVNDAPTAQANEAETNEDSAVSINVLGNDSDPDASDNLTVTAASVPSGSGTATVEGDGTITYNPGSAFQYLAVGESATVTITYAIADGHGGTATATATVIVTGVNDAPTAHADPETTDEDSPVNIKVLGNDTDPDTSDTLTVTGASVSPGEGSVKLEDDGSLTYDPGDAFQHLAVGESATVTISYDIADGHLGTSSAVATVTVTGVNDGPTANDDPDSTTEDSAKTIDVLANDTDPDTSDKLTVTGAHVTLGKGSVKVEADGDLTYDPGQSYQNLAHGESATVEITYAIADGHLGTSTAVLTVTVQGVNDGPTAHGELAATDEDSPVAIDVLTNDVDPDASDQLTVTSVSVPADSGQVTLADNVVIFDPGEDFQYLAEDETATVEILYQISDGRSTSTATATVTVTGVNDAPTAVAETATVDEDSTVAIDVLKNDTDPDESDELTVTGASLTEGSGTLSRSADGVITYDPGQHYQHLGVDEFAIVKILYHIADGHGGTSSATATVKVTGLNDGPTAVDETFTTDEDTAKSFDVVADDPDETDTLTVTSAEIIGGEGSVSVTGVTGDQTITYDPQHFYQYLAVGEFETVTISYVVDDGHGGTSSGLATVKVTGVNDPPTADADEATVDEDSTVEIDVLFNDDDPDTSDQLTVTGATLVSGGGDVSLGTGGIIIYDPGQSYQHLGVDEFATVTISYDIADGHLGTSSAQVTVTVTGVNDAPTTDPDVATVDENSTVEIDVLFNDDDTDTNDELTVTSATVPFGSGSVSFGADNILTFDPGQDFQYLAVGVKAEVAITYDISDGHGGTASAVATVTVTGVNDAPTANPDSVPTDEDAAVTFDVLLNDTDPDTSDVLRVTGALVISGFGTVDVEADGDLTYDPGEAYQYLGEGQSATVTIKYDIADGHLGTASAEVTVTVGGLNDAPEVSGEVSATASENDAAFSLDLLAGASDPDAGDSLNVTNLELVSGDASGVSLSGNSLSIDPSAYNHLAAGETAVIRYSYQVVDSAGESVGQTATVTVEGATDIVWQIEQSEASGTANDGIVLEGDGATYTVSFSGDGDGSHLSGGESATVRLQFDSGSTQSDDLDPAVGSDSTLWAAVFDSLVAQGGTLNGDKVSIEIHDGGTKVGVGTFDKLTGTLQVTADAGQNIDVGLPLLSFDLAAVADNGGGFETAKVNQSSNGWGVSPDTHLDDGEGLFVDFLTTDIDTFTFEIDGFKNTGSSPASFTVVGLDADGKTVAIQSTPNSAGITPTFDGDRAQFTATANSSVVHSFTIAFAAAAVHTVKIIGEGGNLQLRSFAGEHTSSGIVIDVPAPVKSLDPQDELVFHKDGTAVAKMTAGTELPVADPETPEAFTVSLADIDQTGDVDDGLSATDSSVTTTIHDPGGPAGSDPIIFDLGEAGIELSATAAFDLDNDGDKQMLAWPGAEDGMLVMDVDGSGAIENGSEVFSPYFGEGGYADALEALASLDVNSDGLLNPDDEAFADLLLWIDGNSDGVSQSGELLGLADLGVVEIDLDTEQVAYTIDGQKVVAEGLFSYDDGSTAQYLAVELDEIGEATASDSDSGTVFALDGLSLGDVIADYDSGDVIDLTRLGFELATGQFTEAAAETYVRYVSPNDDLDDDDPDGEVGDLFVDPTGSGDFVLAAHLATAPNNVLVRLADDADAVQDVLVT